MTTAFSELLRQASPVSGAIDLEVPPDWLQGRSLFGGLQSALAAAAMRSLVPSRSLRSLQTNFIGPLAGKVRVRSTILRQGKNTTQLEAKLVGESGLATQCMGIFGDALPSAVVVTPVQEAVPQVAPLVFPFLPGVTPNFTQHFSMRLLRGHAPFSGTATHDAVYELDMRDEGTATESHIIALADVVPPLALSFLSAPSFGSTLSWMLKFLTEPVADLPLSGWRLDSQLVSAEGGYTNQSSTLWSPRGQAMALSRQCMLVFG